MARQVSERIAVVEELVIGSCRWAVPLPVAADRQQEGSRIRHCIRDDDRRLQPFGVPCDIDLPLLVLISIALGSHRPQELLDAAVRAGEFGFSRRHGRHQVVVGDADVVEGIDVRVLCQSFDAGEPFLLRPYRERVEQLAEPFLGQTAIALACPAQTAERVEAIVDGSGWHGAAGLQKQDENLTSGGGHDGGLMFGCLLHPAIPVVGEVVRTDGLDRSADGVGSASARVPEACPGLVGGLAANRLAEAGHG
ncbi:MAG: hypothetical protein JNK87_35265 [Bryobacterales bacterium]|nr:hypothetical protein [Bryobacterales bacterium]